MSKDIAKVLRNLEYGVYVITMGKGTDGNAFTGSWVSQVSSEPPMVALAVNNKHQSTPKLKEHGGFVVHLLAEGQEMIAKTYYGPAESGYDKLRSANPTSSPATGSPILSGSVGWIDCQIVDTISTGNHTLFIGEVKAGELNQSGTILTKTNSKLSYTG